MPDKETYHFLVIHFPIALFITGYIINCICFYSERSEFLDFIKWLMGMGVLWGLISIITGLIADWDVIFELHGILMVTCVLYFCFLYFLHNKKINNRLFLFLHTIGILLLVYGAHQGAVLCGLHF